MYLCKPVIKEINKIVRVVQVVEERLMCEAENCTGEMLPCLNRASPGNFAHCCNKCKDPLLYEFSAKFPLITEIVLTEKEF